MPRTKSAAAEREYDRTKRKDTPWRKARRTGYRTDSTRHQLARFKLSASRRKAIARKGGTAPKVVSTAARRAAALQGWATRRKRAT